MTSTPPPGAEQGDGTWSQQCHLYCLDFFGLFCIWVVVTDKCFLIKCTVCSRSVRHVAMSRTGPLLHTNMSRLQLHYNKKKKQSKHFYISILYVHPAGYH